jgi:hypothetical protein
MRVAVILLSIVLLAPAVASARNPARCQNLAKQLVHYDAMKVRAHEKGQHLWVDRYEAQIQRVEGHFAENCPELYAEQQATQQFAKMMKAAASAAFSYLTLGAY